MRARWLVVLLVIAAILAACGGDGGATEPPPPNSPRASDAAAPTEDPGATDGTETPADESTEPGESAEPGEPTDEPDATPASDDPFLGRVVQTAVNRLRLRGEPATDGDLAATLPRGAALFVLDGPREADGYTWYQVVRMDGDGASVGWVASASPEGEAWIEEAEADCPATPESFEELRDLSPGVALACFSGTPISIEARLTTCNCDIDATVLDPDWFNATLFEGAPVILAEPAGAGSIDLAEGMLLVLDPDGEADDPLPLDAVVEVTGAFDHPAARECTATAGEGESRPDPSCRFEFAVSSLHAAS